jgi:hypothetical protein
MNLVITLMILCLTIFHYASSEAAYLIYLKNGQVIRGVDEITEENGKMKIYKYGVTFKLQKTSVVKIEEYEKGTVHRERGLTLSPQPEGELPDYQRYEESSGEIPEISVEKSPPGEELHKLPSEETRQYRKSDKRRKPSEYKLKTVQTVIFRDGKFEPGPQLQDLRKRDQEGTLPEHFKPYKDFLEEQFQKQKKNLEGQPLEK